MEKVSRWLEGQDEPRSRNQVESANLGKSRDHVRQAMDTLTTEGYIAESKGPNRARLLTSIKSFRGSPDFASGSPGEPDAGSPSSPSAYRRGDHTGEHEDEAALLAYLETVINDPEREVTHHDGGVV